MSQEDKEKAKAKEAEGADKKRVDMDPLLRYLFEPTLKQLRGLTNIPLGQVNNLAWMAVFDVATVQLAEYIEYLDKKRVVLALLESEILTKPREAYKEALKKEKVALGLCDGNGESIKRNEDEKRVWGVGIQEAGKALRIKLETQVEGEEPKSYQSTLKECDEEIDALKEDKARGLKESRLRILEVELWEKIEALAQLIAQVRAWGAFAKAKAQAQGDYEKAEENFTEKPPQVLSLSEVWSEIYSWLRRSIDGAGIMTASGLAMKQLELQEMAQEPSEVIDYR